MKKTTIEFLHDASVARITLSDGKGNVLDHEMMDELQTHFDAFQNMPSLKLITLEGAGKHFSFGASVEEHQQEYAATMLQGFHRLFYSLRDLSIPSAALISGQCLGGGLELALMCNFMFADESAKLGQPEIRLGVFPPPASIILPEKIGLARAEEFLLTGKTISAQEAKTMGLLNEVYADRATLLAETEKWIATHILPKSASSLRFAVRAVRAKFNHVLSNFLPQLEIMYVNQLMQTHDAREGIRSFLEKRNPEWENHILPIK
ncbi:MAG: enoyl-CoA hydratase/isomerase family protein [Bacteroidia bacterium]|nr:enoyl-CoA hydratase/isomerase family protein [Bacteroidia bacterium]